MTAASSLPSPTLRSNRASSDGLSDNCLNLVQNGLHLEMILLIVSQIFASGLCVFDPLLAKSESCTNHFSGPVLQLPPNERRKKLVNEKYVLNVHCRT